MRKSILKNKCRITARGVNGIEVPPTGLYFGEYIDRLFCFTLSTYNPQLNEASTTPWGLKKFKK